jgi:hypothetical protein
MVQYSTGGGINVYLPTPKNDGVKVSWDDDIPNISKNKSHVPNHQPGTGLNQIVFHTKCSETSTRSNCQRKIFGTPEMLARLRTNALVALFGLSVVSSWACTMTRKNHMGVSENGVLILQIHPNILRSTGK